MVRIRLRKIGAKAQPSYRIVVADKEAQRDGRFLEILGFYNPRTEPATITVKEDLVYDWLKKGAQPSELGQPDIQERRRLGTLRAFQKGRGAGDIAC